MAVRTLSRAILILRKANMKSLGHNSLELRMGSPAEF